MNLSLLHRIFAACLFAGALIGASPSAVVAQDATEDGSDAEARANFEAGRVAYDNARYEDALQYFRRAHQLSGRAQLLYNVAQTLDRLRRDAEAVEAFEAFLEGAPDTSKRREVEARIGILRQQLTPEPAPEPSVEPADPSPTVPTPEEVAISEPQPQSPEPEAEEASGGVKPWVWAVIAGVLVVGAGVGIGIAVSGGDNIQDGSLGRVEL